jgi:hypothetical protein
MQRQFTSTLALLAVLAAPEAFAQTVCTQSTDNLTIGQGGVSCATAAPNLFVAQNSYIRRYTFPGSCAIPPGQTISAVDFGVQSAQAGPNGAGMQPANVRLYSILTGAPLTFGNMTLLRDEPIILVDQTLQIVNVPLSSALAVPAGRDIVAEVFIPNGIAAQNRYFPGSNGVGQSAPSYIAAPACGIAEPTDYALLTPTPFPNVHLIIDLVFSSGPPTIGTNYCTANNNSTGTTGLMRATGSAVVATNNVLLNASRLPLNAFGFFLTSRTQGFVANPGGSSGNLCISGGIGRFVGPGQIQNTGTTGEIGLAINLTAMPTPVGPVAAVAGETWNFQAWHRDAISGNPTSNFTDGLALLLQ